MLHQAPHVVRLQGVPGAAAAAGRAAVHRFGHGLRQCSSQAAAQRVNQLLLRGRHQGRAGRLGQQRLKARQLLVLLVLLLCISRRR